MDEANNFILIKSEPEALTLYKENALKIYNSSLNKDKPTLNENKNNQNKNMNKKNSFKIRINKKLSKSGSAVNLLSSKTHNSFDFTKLNKKVEISDELINKDNNENSFNNSKKVSFNITDKNNKIYNPKNFYLTSTLYLMNKKNMNNSNCSTKETNNMIDLIHQKEIELCLDLIKKLPEKGINKNNENDKEENLEEYNNLIELIRQFKFDDINNQKLIEYQILNNNNNSFAYNNIPNSDLIQTNNISNSINSNLKQNNLYLDQNINNLSSEKNLNNSSIEMNNNIRIQNISNILNEKSKLVKSSSTNDINPIKEQKNNLIPRPSKINNFQSEINFHTGFVRSQKNLYNDTFKAPVKKISINQKRFQRQKKENEKLTLPEIEEYKSIIKQIRKKRIIENRKIREKIEMKKDKSDFFLKDKLIEELKDIYQDQKNTFLRDVKENFGDDDENKIKIDPIKQEINANIRNINQIKRKQNYFVDGYSRFGGEINKRLNDFNYILGNKFHDKDQKKEKEEKFYKCLQEYENKMNRFRSDFFKEYKIYKKIFKPKFDFSKDKNYGNL